MATERLSTVALVASTAAITCAVTGLAAAYMLPKYYKQRQHLLEEHSGQFQLYGNGRATSTCQAAVCARASCSTPDPTLPAVTDHHHNQLQQDKQHQQHLHHKQQQSQQQQQQQQQQQASSLDTALFSPVNPQKRPNPYDVRPRHNYLCWDDYFMAVAFLSAERSKDPNKQVGACIVNDENIILSIGYNGFPRGCADSRLPWAKRAESGSILDTKYPYVVHAEANALLNKNQAHVTGARIYVTLFPCNECAKLLIQAGIREVVYHEAKLEPTGKRPGTMEEAAAEEAVIDALEEERVGSGSGSRSQGSGHSCCGSSAACGDDAAAFAADQVQQAKQSKKQARFSVGAIAELDASYVASQRLLMMAGVKLRQHTLQRSIFLGQRGSSSSS